MNTLFIGQNLIRLNKVESTNNFASALIAGSPVPEGTVITAVEQTSGKGQRGSSWISEPGKNLTLSAILKPAFLSAIEQFKLNKAVTLAIRDFFLFWGIEKVTVKWPNDIYIQDRKAAGILIENQLKNAQLSCSIVGIGINVNQVLFPDNLSNAVSLKLITGKEYKLQQCLEKLCGFIEKRYLQLRRNENMDEEYLRHLYNFGIICNYKISGETVKGKIAGISPEGKIIIEYPGAVLKAYSLKEISLNSENNI